MAITYIDVTVTIDASKLKQLASNLSRAYVGWKITAVQIVHAEKQVMLKLALPEGWADSDADLMQQLYQERILSEPYELALCSERMFQWRESSMQQATMTQDLLRVLMGLVGENGYVEDEWCYCVSDDICAICQARNTYNVYRWAWKYLA